VFWKLKRFLVTCVASSIFLLSHLEMKIYYEMWLLLCGVCTVGAVEDAVVVHIYL
jgi:hypothetical protein